MSSAVEKKMAYPKKCHPPRKNFQETRYGISSIDYKKGERADLPGMSGCNEFEQPSRLPSGGGYGIKTMAVTRNVC